MKTRVRLPFALAGALNIVAFGVSAPEATAAVLNVATTAQLQSAVANAQPGDTIVLAPGVYQPSGALFVGVDMAIVGDPSAPSIVDGGGDNIFFVAADNVRFENLTLRNGAAAIVNAGRNVLVRGVTITANTSIGISGGDGGGHVTVVNSTIAGNRGPDGDPAFAIASGCGSFTLQHVTIADNDRGLFAGSCSDDILEVRNTLVVFNDRDCGPTGGAAFTGNSSFDSDGTCRTGIAGAAAAFATTPFLAMGVLGNNGGPTMTIVPGGLAVDAGSSCTEPLDQRGAIRDAACDIGAFEHSAAATLTSTTGTGTVDILTNAGTFLTFSPVAEADMPNQAGKPAGVTFPHGFFEWSLGPLPIAGTTADVTFIFPSPLTAPPQYWKVINGAWTDICRLRPCAVNGNQLTVSFRDGGVGDLDGLANTVIVDPGGLGIGGESADVTPPQIRCGEPDGQWRASDVSLACTASDGESGLADASTAAFSLSTAVGPGLEIDNAVTGSRDVCDRDENCATAGPIGGNRVDKKGPGIAVTSPSAGSTYQLGEAVIAAYSCSDGGAGVDSCAGPVHSGAAIDTHSGGTKTFTVHATDNVGNPGTISLTYQVACDYVSVGLSPSTVVAGNAVRVHASLRSCATAAQAIALRFTLIGTGPSNGCGPVKTVLFTTPPSTLSPGFNRTLSFAYRVPASTCPGNYSVSVDTLIDGRVVDSTSATLTVVR